MIEQQRTMARPGEGIVRPGAPTVDYKEYPKHMRHPGFSPGVADQEIKEIGPDGRATGRVRYTGGKSIRYPDVLVHGPADEEHHLALGYKSIGKSDAAAFQRAVQSFTPPVENYVAIEYPKWVHGKLVQSTDEEAQWLKSMGINVDGSPMTSSEVPAVDPVVDAEVNTLEVFTPPAATETREERIARLKAELAELVEDEPSAPPPALIDPREIEVNKPEMTRSEKIKAGLARKKAERDQMASLTESVSESHDC